MDLSNLMLTRFKEQRKKEITKLKDMEEEESKRIAIDINNTERKAALDCCTRLGFTLANTPGLDEIKPKALGMKGIEVNFDALGKRDSPSHIVSKPRSKRVDLGNVPTHPKADFIPRIDVRGGDESVEEFIKFDEGEGQDFESRNYNHKLRRKLRRAIDAAEVRKEMLVRQRAIDYCVETNIEPPVELKTPSNPQKVRGQRILGNGTLETTKQERVRSKIEQTEYNKASGVLRKQAKQIATEAGLRKHAELTHKFVPKYLIENEQCEMNLQNLVGFNNPTRFESSTTTSFTNSDNTIMKPGDGY